MFSSLTLQGSFYPHMANCMHTDTGMTGKSFHQVKTVSCITLLPFQTQLLHKLVFFLYSFFSMPLIQTRLLSLWFLDCNPLPCAYLSIVHMHGRTTRCIESASAWLVWLVYWGHDHSKTFQLRKEIKNQGADISTTKCLQTALHYCCPMTASAHPVLDSVPPPILGALNTARNKVKRLAFNYR